MLSLSLKMTSGIGHCAGNKSRGHHSQTRRGLLLLDCPNNVFDRDPGLEDTPFCYDLKIEKRDRAPYFEVIIIGHVQAWENSRSNGTMLCHSDTLIAGKKARHADFV